MCYKAILPTAIIPSNSDGDLVQLTFSFNRWLKMLKSYGKLDESSLESDFSLISRVLRNYGFKKKLIRAVQRCRDLALARDLKISSLVSALVIALNILSKLQTNREIKRVERQRANQGMTERYRPLSRRLASEKIRKIDKRLCFTDLMADDKETTKLVRRFVEKRAAQIVYKNQGKRQRCSNLFRQSVRRATSFSLYNKQFAEYDFQQRSAPGTHWRVKKNRKGQKKMVAKRGYTSLEAAIVACRKLAEAFPEDPRPISAYKCASCGKWHIGHHYVIDETMNNESFPRVS